MLANLFRRFTSDKQLQESAFSLYNFPSTITRLLNKKGFIDATEIQKSTWPLIMQGKDLVGIAKTGSGKTLSYLLPMIPHIMKTQKNNLKTQRNQQPTSLVILPTRELAKQVSDEFNYFAFACGIRFATVYGGEKKYRQQTFLNNGVHTVIGTPGRIIDFMSDNVLELGKVDYLVVDEADMLFDMGFEQSVRNIIMSTSDVRQTVMFTATWPKQIEVFASDYLTNPEKIQIGGSEITMNEDIYHMFIYCPEEVLQDNLTKIINENIDKKFLVFVNTKVHAEFIKEKLLEAKIKCESLHSDKDQFQRNLALKGFANGNVRVLIATDVASRGIDIKDIDYVVNYQMPTNSDSFVHRVGRTGRAGKQGIAISFYDEKSRKEVMKFVCGKMKDIGVKVPEKFKSIAYSYY